MSTEENQQIVADAYAAFGRGDIEAVIGSLADDVVWVNHAPLPHQPVVSSAVRMGFENSSGW